jgi:NADH-quinone oxidoreductase subunit F
MGYPHPSHPRETVLLSRYFGDAEARTYAGWLKRGGYRALEKALGMGREKVIDEVKVSGVRGRGGAGFPAGVKWSFMPKERTRPHYLCCNADEGEPGTFKDRELMRWTPHAVVEGCAIAAYAIQAEHVYVYIRGEFTESIRVMQAAIDEAYAKGILGPNVLGHGVKIEMTIHRGAGAYICGEETALMNSIEGMRGNPRIKPPFPAVAGLWGCPTTINNVETLAALPHIIEKGGAWYQGLSLSSPKSTGTKLFSICGNVAKPGNYEVTMGFPLKDLLFDLAGGIPGGRKLKAVQPGARCRSSPPRRPRARCWTTRDAWPRGRSWGPVG